MTIRGPTTWRPARQHLAAITLLIATLTGAAGAALGASGSHVLGAGAYVVAALLALFFPAAIVVQVIAGQVLAASVLLAPDGPAPLLLLPMVASILATAELLAVVGRLDTPLARDPSDDLRRMGITVLIGGGVFGAVALAGRLPGPTGILAIALASAACVVLAILLVSDAR